MMSMERRRIERMEVSQQVNLPLASRLNNISMVKPKQVGFFGMRLIKMVLLQQLNLEVQSPHRRHYSHLQMTPSIS
jgi:hypothetical protein